MADFLHQSYTVFISFIKYILRLSSNCLPPTVLNCVIQLLPYGFLGSICCGLDALFLSVKHQVFRAVVDNTAHGVIAFVSWCVVSEIRTRKDLMDGILCGFIACAIDVDHFIAAKSFKLQVRRSLDLSVHVYVAVNFLFQVIFVFTFVSNSLAYITKPKNNGKIKIT